MKFNEDYIKHDYLQHFLEGGAYPIRINPDFENESPYSLEDEMLIIMYIEKEMPYLKLYYNKEWNEAMVELIDDIPLEHQVFFYKKELKSTRNELFAMIDNVQEAIGL